jgi:hypothetical protein
VPLYDGSECARKLGGDGLTNRTPKEGKTARRGLRYVERALNRMPLSPRRGVEPSPEQELLGALTSHGPTRGLYTPAGPFRTSRRPEATGAPAANPPMSAERMRAAVSPAAGQGAVLQL